MLQYRGTGKRLADTDLPELGHMIGVGEDEIHAILDIEAAGRGFDAQNRLKALYEPAVAYKIASPTVRAKLLAHPLKLAHPQWGAIPYPKDSYPKIEACAAIDESVAARATSWGIGQILGTNAVAVGYKTAQDMIADFASGEKAQLRAVIQFLITNHLDDELRRHDWAGLARGYNGPGYAHNAYDTHLAQAFAKWQLIPDTPWVPDDCPPRTAA